MEKFIDIFYDVAEFEYSDIRILNVGRHQCEPSHAFGPAVRPYFLLHFVLHGEGKYYIQGREFTVKESQAFIIFEEDITLYVADKENPWHYVWIGFIGKNALHYIEKCGLNRLSPVFTYDKNTPYLRELFEKLITYGQDRMVALGYFHLIFAEMMQSLEKHSNANQSSSYVNRACNYILSNYMDDLKISDIASSLNLNRSYLCRLFKLYIGETPQEFLIRIRMERARELLLRKDILISDCGRSVGYVDRIAFSKIFKKYFSVSPDAFRKKYLCVSEEEIIASKTNDIHHH